MKRTLLSGLAVALLAGVVGGAEGRTIRSTLTPALMGQASSIPMPSQLSPVPDPAYNQYPAYYPPSGAIDPSYGAPILGQPSYGAPIIGQPTELYTNVRYHGTRNISPCAVPTVIQVPDPCNRDKCCKTCVSVQVCVPPCDPKRVKVTRDGNRVRYDYGKYSVVVRTVGDHVVVHYGD